MLPDTKMPPPGRRLRSSTSSVGLRLTTRASGHEPVGGELPKTAPQIAAKRIRVPAIPPNPRTVTGFESPCAPATQAGLGSALDSKRILSGGPSVTPLSAFDTARDSAHASDRNRHSPVRGRRSAL